MKLTTKDKAFLENLRTLLDEKQLTIQLKDQGIKRMVLRKNYGDAIERSFAQTRQGVRWRFQRLFGDIYVSAYETILFVESHFGTELRHYAMVIARQRAELRAQAQKMGKMPLPRRQPAEEDATGPMPKM